VSQSPSSEAPPPVWILSGMSGAGKATALQALEAGGAECVDNLPVALAEGFASLPRTRPAVAVIDARQADGIQQFETIPGVRVLFLDAGDDVLVRRMAESTRHHPCEHAGRGRGAVQAERELLQAVRGAADVVIDTTNLEPAALAAQVADCVLPQLPSPPPFRLTLSSFGFKFGTELEADWVIDARLMSNPFWQPELRPLTGLDTPVRDFVMEQHEAREFVKRLREQLEWALPLYQDHRRRFLHVAIGCTGGRHRSVVLAEALAESLRSDERQVTVRHRDVHRNDPRD
jgi:RNase adapter protein RapZ